MTVRVAPLWAITATSTDDTPNAALLADDEGNVIQMVYRDYDKDRALDGVYELPFINDEKISAAVAEADGDTLDGLVLLGLTNTMYLTGETQDFPSLSDAVDHVFDELWPKENQ